MDLAPRLASRDDDDWPAAEYGEPVTYTVVQTGLPRLLLTPEEAAHALGIGRTKLYQLLADGFLPSVRIGGSRRISTAALDQFVRELEPATGWRRAG